MTRGASPHPHEPARDGAGRRLPPLGDREGTRSARRARHIQGERLRLLPGAGHSAADHRLRPAGFPRRPGGLMLDHDTDAYEKISRAFLDGQPAGNLTRDHILDNITVYW